MTRRTLLHGAAALALLCAAARPARAQEGAPWRGAIAGVVKDSAGARIPGASVTARSIGLQAISDDSGRFRLVGLPPGPVTLQVRRLGYVPASLSVTLAGGDTREVNVSLVQSAEALAALEVRANPLRGKMSGFNERRERGIGTFITRDEIERRQAGKVSQLLRYVAGVYVPQDNSDMRPSAVGMRRAAGLSPGSNCGVQLYVDGQHYPDGKLDDFRPSEVEGIEIYRSASEIPATFRSRDTMCGIIAIWTRDPASLAPKR